MKTTQEPSYVLIKLVSVHPYPSVQSIPLANAFLKAYALESPVLISLADFFICDDAAACAAKLAEPLPAAIGFSVYLWNRDLVSKIAAELRRSNSEIKLFCGGPEVTADPEPFINDGIFDFAIIGEGEVPFFKLCQAITSDLDYSRIPGVILPGSTIPPPPPPVTNMDAIPSPYLTGVIDTAANPGILWQLSRGCCFTCDFCFDSRGIHGVRYFSLERLEAELQHFAATGVSQVFVLDSTFNFDQKRAKRILRMIKKIAPDIHFHFEVRNEFIDREMAALFADIPCSLQIGLQSADSEVLKFVGRSFNRNNFSEKVGLLNESGAIFGFDLIYGLPGDNLEGFKRSLDYALSLYPNHLDIFPLAVLPGTRLASNGTALGLLWNIHSPYILECTDRFSKVDMAAAAELATAADIFYTRGKSVAWFNAIVAVLNLKPSDLLQEFSLWLIERSGRGTKESDFCDDDVWKMQQLFLKHLFSGNKLNRFLPLVLDLANYHHIYAEVLLESSIACSPDLHVPANLHDASFRPAPSTRIVRFNYEIEKLLDCGEPRILWMYKNIPQSSSHAVIYLNNGLVCTEPLDSPYIQLLEQIRDEGGKINVSKIGITNNDIYDFLIFALKEGIILNK